VTLADAELLDRWHTPEQAGEFNDFGLAYPPARAMIDDGLLGDSRGTLIVERAVDGEPVGTVGWRAVQYGPNAESRAWNIGISLIPEARGKGLGADAQRVLAAYLFATTTVNRIEAMTDIENIAEQRALEKAGYHRDGVMLGAQFRAGGFHDLVVYSVVRPRAK
jgi:RimJ/RimL family protein N-acetyltransferase